LYFKELKNACESKKWLSQARMIAENHSYAGPVKIKETYDYVTKECKK
jgi:hypothetical protein